LLAGIPLLRKSAIGVASRSPGEIEALVKAAYGAKTDSAALLPAFDAVARALNRGDLAHAMTVAVLTGLPELDWDGAVRLANAEQQLRKFNRNEPRDWHGCWTDDDGTDPSGQDRLPQNPVDFNPGESGSATVNDDDNSEPPDNRSPLARKYDDLGPVAFAKQVILFGDQLGRQGKKLTPEEQEAARAEYDFLQSRLSFWLGYDNKPYQAQGNLLSAALTLYDGAYNAGIIAVHDGFPPSMLDVGLGVTGLDNHQPDAPLHGPSVGHIFEDEALPFARPASSEELVTPTAEYSSSGLFSRIVDNADAGIPWDDPDIAARGSAWEVYNDQADPEAQRIGPNSKAFDKSRESTAEAISEKILDPLSYSYLNYHGKVYGQIKRYIDAAADYGRPRTEYDLNPDRIEQRTIKLAIRDYISPDQQQQIIKAVNYGEDRKIRVMVTRIRD
jgi:hypothetical protein